MLGLFRNRRRKNSPAAATNLAGKLMRLLIDLRAESRKKKDFATADRIRNALAEIGVDPGRPARRNGVEPEVGHYCEKDECALQAENPEFSRETSRVSPFRQKGPTASSGMTADPRLQI